MSRRPEVVPDLQQLRERVRLMERPTARVDLATHPSLRAPAATPATASGPSTTTDPQGEPGKPGELGLPVLRGGESYEVTDLGLAMALVAGPSAAGDWCAVVGAPDFGVEAAVGFGIDLTRTVLVPEPGEQWLEVVAALVDAVPLVLLRPPARVSQTAAARLSARLRRHDAVLLVHAPDAAPDAGARVEGSRGPSWPRCAARLSVLGAPRWSGVGSGHGRLRSRQVTVQVRQGAAPPRLVELSLPGSGLQRSTVAAAVATGRTPHVVPVAEAG